MYVITIRCALQNCQPLLKVCICEWALIRVLPSIRHSFSQQLRVYLSLNTQVTYERSCWRCKSLWVPQSFIVLSAMKFSHWYFMVRNHNRKKVQVHCKYDYDCVCGRTFLPGRADEIGFLKDVPSYESSTTVEALRFLLRWFSKSRSSFDLWRLRGRSTFVLRHLMSSPSYPCFK